MNPSCAVLRTTPENVVTDENDPSTALDENTALDGVETSLEGIVASDYGIRAEPDLKDLYPNSLHSVPVSDESDSRRQNVEPASLEPLVDSSILKYFNLFNVQNHEWPDYIVASMRYEALPDSEKLRFDAHFVSFPQELTMLFEWVCTNVPKISDQYQVKDNTSLGKLEAYSKIVQQESEKILKYLKLFSSQKKHKGILPDLINNIYSFMKTHFFSGESLEPDQASLLRHDVSLMSEEAQSAFYHQFVKRDIRHFFYNRLTPAGGVAIRMQKVISEDVSYQGQGRADIISKVIDSFSALENYIKNECDYSCNTHKKPEEICVYSVLEEVSKQITTDKGERYIPEDALCNVQGVTFSGSPAILKQMFHSFFESMLFLDGKGTPRIIVNDHGLIPRMCIVNNDLPYNRAVSEADFYCANDTEKKPKTEIRTIKSSLEKLGGLFDIKETDSGGTVFTLGFPGLMYRH